MCVCVCFSIRTCVCHPILENDLLKWNYAEPWPMANGTSCNLSSSWAVNKIWLAIIWFFAVDIAFHLPHLFVLSGPPPWRVIRDVLMSGWYIADGVIWGQRAEHCDDGKWVVVGLRKSFMEQVTDANAKCQKWLPSSRRRGVCGCARALSFHITLMLWGPAHLFYIGHLLRPSLLA